jgi:hypothetical protein
MLSNRLPVPECFAHYAGASDDTKSPSPSAEDEALASASAFKHENEILRTMVSEGLQ